MMYGTYTAVSSCKARTTALGAGSQGTAARVHGDPYCMQQIREANEPKQIWIEN